MTKQRKSDYPIHEMFLNRWSPRAFTVSQSRRKNF